MESHAMRLGAPSLTRTRNAFWSCSTSQVQNRCSTCHHLVRPLSSFRRIWIEKNTSIRLISRFGEMKGACWSANHERQEAMTW